MPAPSLRAPLGERLPSAARRYAGSAIRDGTLRLMTSGTRSDQRVSIFPHNDRAGLARCEYHFAARKAAITAVGTNDGDLIEIDTNLGPIGGGAALRSRKPKLL